MGERMNQEESISDRDGSQPSARRRWRCLGALVLAPLLVALLGAVVAFRDDLFPDQPAPQRLPDPPATAERLTGVASTGFFASALAIGATDGQTYQYRSYVGWEAWQPDSTGFTWSGGRGCNERAQRDLAAAAGPLAAGVGVQEVGEWCPGALASYALAADGSLWLHRQRPPCTVFFTTILCVLLPVAALAGAALGLLVWLGVRLSAKKSGQQ